MAFILVISGIVPSYLWLRYYLTKDLHPEPRGMIVKTFVLGALLAPLAIIAQWLVPGDSQAPGFFLWAAFVEEVVKFMAVYYLVIHDVEFDEPVDAMIYMVTAAMGFAAMENIIVLFNTLPDGVGIAFRLLGFRFLGATLLHALTSALVGYFLGLAWFYRHHSRKLIWFGILAATLLHFFFNALLLNLSIVYALISSSLVLVIVLGCVLVLFAKLRERSESRLSTGHPF